MLKNDIIWPDSRRFKSKTEWEPVGFFSECLCNSTHFDLMLGFFSSSAISVLSDGFATFLYNGGRMRFIINDILTENDKNAILLGQSNTQLLPYFDLDDIEELANTLSEQDKHFFQCLAWLIYNDRIEIKVISPLTNGISHTKCGSFKDTMNTVAFDGSCNFSRMALVENIESIVVSCDWDNRIAEATISEINSDFEKTFEGHNDAVKYMDVCDIKTRITDVFEKKDIDTLLEDEYRIIETKSKYELVPNISKALEKARKRVVETLEMMKERKNQEDISERVPCFPYSSGPRGYQKVAFDNWKNNKQKGLFAMATGTGKTITSLNCLLEIYKRLGYYKALILVPTITLVNQWEEECRKFNFRNIIKVCSKNTKWNEEIDAVEFNEQMDVTEKKHSYIIICTYASYSRDIIAKRLNVFPRKKVLLIADEAHNMGSGKIKSRFNKIPYLRRIGLSATPERQYDEDTNSQLMNFFGCEVEYTFDYPMEKAIQNGVLCRYNYYPHIVKLTASEMQEYLDISVKLAKYYTFNGNFRPKEDSILTALLLRRKRIIHKATNKIDVFKKILGQKIKEKGNLKYTLVYVPEGNKSDEDADIFDNSDMITTNKDDVHLIDLYTSIVRDTYPTTTVKQFTSLSSEKNQMLSDFSNGKLDVLTSMKCLDEGVDIPRSELAIFCASTGNPRQFIQRRGRILRVHPDKHMAEIHDLVVAPEICLSEETYNMERNLLATELKRVYNFSKLSENMDATIVELDAILKYYNLSIFNS